MRKFSFYPVLPFLFILCLIFTSNAFAGDKTFTLTINSQQVIVNLPESLPSMDTAIYTGEECFNLKICRQEFCLNARLPGHDHVDFIFTDQGEVIALVWMRTKEVENIFWKYVGGIPILSSIDEIKAIILGDKKIKET